MLICVQVEMSSKDDRVTMKLDRPLWDEMERLISEHPQWGIISVPEFVRRAIDSEIRTRKDEDGTRVINVCLSPETRDRRRKGP